MGALFLRKSGTLLNQVRDEASVAFAMGQQPRLGAGSQVFSLLYVSRAELSDTKVYEPYI